MFRGWLLITGLIIALGAKGFSSLALSTPEKDSVSKKAISSLSFRLLIGSDVFLNSQEISNEIKNTFSFTDFDDVFATIGGSIHLGTLPNKYGKFHVNIVFVQFFTNTIRNLSGSSLDFYGNYYGFGLGKDVLSDKRINLQFGVNLLRSTYHLEIQEGFNSNDPSTIFQNSRILKLVYNANIISPYVNLDYGFKITNYSKFLIGLHFDYKYILPDGIWKLFPSDDYNVWLQNQGTRVDLPFFENHLLGMGLNFTFKTEF